MLLFLLLSLEQTGQFFPWMSSNPFCYPLTQSMEVFVNLFNPKTVCELSVIPLLIYRAALSHLILLQTLSATPSLYNTEIGGAAMERSIELLNSNSLCGDEQLIPEDQVIENLEHFERGEVKVKVKVKMMMMMMVMMAIMRCDR